MNELKPHFKKRLILFILKALFASATLMLLLIYLMIITP